MSSSIEKKSYAFNKNKLINDAIIFAVNAHADTFRKGSELPYILHPIEVAAIAGGLVADRKIASQLKDGDAGRVVAAAVLHDTVEDTETTVERLIIAFGEEVAQLVANESENKREGTPAGDTWKERKQETIAHLKSCTDIRVIVIAMADKLANLRALNRDHMNLGDELWERFNQKDPAEHGWYYKSVLEVCGALEGTAAYEEYKSLLDGDIFKPVK